MLQTRRGRCGEYSRLFFKAMEALNYQTRWVVDWEVSRSSSGSGVGGGSCGFHFISGERRRRRIFRSI